MSAQADPFRTTAGLASSGPLYGLQDWERALSSLAKAMSALPWLIKRSRGLHFFRFLSLSFIFFLGQHYCNNHLLQVIEVLAILIYVASSFFFITAWQRAVLTNGEADAHAQYWVGLPIDAYTAWPDRDSQFNYPKVRINEVRINKHLLYNFLCL